MKSNIAAAIGMIVISGIAYAADARTPSPCAKLEQDACTGKEVVPGFKSCKWVGESVTVAGAIRKPHCAASSKKLPAEIAQQFLASHQEQADATASAQAKPARKR